MTLTEFLLAQIAEDEADGARHAEWCALVLSDERGCDCDGAARVLADCEAKRRIVETASNLDRDGCDSRHGIEGDLILRTLASVYADHPDYLPEWRH